MYGLNKISNNIQNDEKITSLGMSVLTAFGLIGLQLNISGFVYDKFGPAKTTVICAIIAVACYIGMSYTTKEVFPLTVILYCLVGFASGGTFTSALATSIKMSPTGGGIGVGLVSCAMSLCLALILFITDTYAKMKCPYTENSCWRQYIRLWAIVCSIGMGIGSIAMFFFHERYFSHLASYISINQPNRQSIDSINFTEETTRYQLGLYIFTHKFFYALFYSYGVSIASCILVLSKAVELWKSYNHNPNLNNFGGTILTIFSFCNAGSNIFSGVLSDVLSRNGLFTEHQYVAIYMILYAVIFSGLGALNVIHHHTNTIVFGALLGSVGVSFGTYPILFPVIVGKVYGLRHFGKHFAFMQIGAGIASVATPTIVTGLSEHWGTYTPIYFGFSGALLTSAIALLAVKVGPFGYK
eukprot:TRINITY_DN4490_c0_g1_i2.p1 TRINITY_DN4490_c0_g1~~TRINITY_DN4490_c0_g1_i2.p1  ORF type:complete len:456 (-),score=45.28 TRINITY_DN4490_c0_g1_i2:51-1286(-)